VPAQSSHLAGQPRPDPFHRRLARLGQQLAAIAPDVEPQEVDPVVEVRDAGLVLVEDQPPGFEPRGQPRLDLFCLFPRVAQRQQVIGVPDQDRGARPRRPGVATGHDVPDSGGLFHPVQGHVHQQGTDDSSNAMGNFCFEVSLGYRRLERPPRVTGGE
jgi:hypothetical protein